MTNVKKYNRLQWWRSDFKIVKTVDGDYKHWYYLGLDDKDVLYLIVEEIISGDVEVFKLDPNEKEDQVYIKMF